MAIPTTVATPAAIAAGIPQRLPLTWAMSPTAIPTGPATASSRRATAARASRNPVIASGVANRGEASTGAKGSRSGRGFELDSGMVRSQGVRADARVTADREATVRDTSHPTRREATMADLTMTRSELDTFLHEERVLRLATLDGDGWPAVAPVWFVWHEGAFWVWNLERAKRTPRLRAGTRCAFTVDGGHEYIELRGASGRLDHRFVPDDDVPIEVRRAFSQRYLHTDEPLPPADHHAWIRFQPITLATWDFRKLAAG